MRGGGGGGENSRDEEGDWDGKGEEVESEVGVGGLRCSAGIGVAHPGGYVGERARAANMSHGV